MLHPVSIAVDKNEGLLYVLEQTDNIYIYRIIDGQLHPLDTINFKHEENFRVRVAGEHLLYSFVENNNFKICELAYNFT